MDENMTPDELGARIRRSTETLSYWRHRGEGPRWFKLGRRVLYAREDVDAWIAAAKAEQESA